MYRLKNPKIQGTVLDSVEEVEDSGRLEKTNARQQENTEEHAKHLNTSKNI